MKCLVLCLALVVLVVVVGCSSRKSEVVCTWVGSTPKSDGKGTLTDELLKGVLGLAGDGATIEFSETGRYKATFHIASLTGRWTMSGSVVSLMPEPEKQGQQVTQDSPLKLHLSQDGSTLSSVKEFESDPQMVFKRRQPGSN